MRTIVAYVQVYSRLDRMTVAALDGRWMDPRKDVPLPLPVNGSHSEVWFAYWCAADAPLDQQDDNFKLAPVYRTSTVYGATNAEDGTGPCCEVCKRDIRELQAFMTATLRQVRDAPKGSE